MKRRLLTAFAAVTILTGIMVPAATAADPPSAGCQFLNDPIWDSHYTGGPIASLDFAAGDLIRMTAAKPTSFGTPTTVTLTVDGAVVDSSTFPGTVEYVIPTTGTHDVGWEINVGNATWDVACNGPDCSTVVVSPDSLKSDSKLQQVALSGATVANDDTMSYAITSVTQDEPTTGGWRQDLKTPDANGVNAERVSLRGERNPSLNGRVYRIAYTVSADHGGDCSGVETVGVPVRKGAAAVDDGDRSSWNSFTGVLVPS